MNIINFLHRISYGTYFPRALLSSSSHLEYSLSCRGGISWTSIPKIFFSRTIKSHLCWPIKTGRLQFVSIVDRSNYCLALIHRFELPTICSITSFSRKLFVWMLFGKLQAKHSTPLVSRICYKLHTLLILGHKNMWMHGLLKDNRLYSTTIYQEYQTTLVYPYILT